MWPIINDGAEQRWIFERIYRPLHGPSKDLQQSSWSKHIQAVQSNRHIRCAFPELQTSQLRRKETSCGTCSSGLPMTLSINTSSCRKISCVATVIPLWQLLNRRGGNCWFFALLKIIGIGHWVSISYRLWILSITAIHRLFAELWE